MLVRFSGVGLATLNLYRCFRISEKHMDNHMDDDMEIVFVGDCRDDYHYCGPKFLV